MNGRCPSCQGRTYDLRNGIEYCPSEACRPGGRVIHESAGTYYNLQGVDFVGYLKIPDPTVEYCPSEACRPGGRVIHESPELPSGDPRRREGIPGAVSGAPASPRRGS